MLLIAGVLPELLSSERMVIEMIELVRVHGPITIVDLVMAVLALNSHHFAILTDMFL
jgi:hypothetical protein